MGSDNASTNDNARQPPEFLVVGRIVRPHGVRGGMKVASESDLIYKLKSSEMIFLGPDKVPATVKSLNLHRKEFLLYIDGCTNRETAESWRDAGIYIRFSELDPLPAGEFFQWQIVGLEVVTTMDEELGKVEDIIVTGANDVYVVRHPSGKEILLPAIESVIQEVDLENERIVVRLIPGLIE
jgi:16S rRNA processing protein RimM